MITKKSLKKEIDALSEEIKDLSKIVRDREFERLKGVENAYKEQNGLIQDVRFRVKNAKFVNDESGARVVVTYQLPMVSIYLDEEGNPAERVPFFYAVNALGLIGIDDYQKISKALEEAKNSIKN